MKKTTLYIILLLVNFSYAQIPGCTDSLAKNYNKQATENNGSCKYKNVKIKPYKSFKLQPEVNESSGLIIYENTLWTHNDGHDTLLYGYNLDSILINTDPFLLYNKTISITKLIDWEALTQDKDYIYLGDFGNNYNGNRVNLSIKKINKKDLNLKEILVNDMPFTYEDQIDFNKQKPQKTNFDCEAMIEADSSLYLFTKQWLNNQTTVYKVNKNLDQQTAIRKESYNIKGLVTDATYIKKYNLLVICGYTKRLKPFIYLFYDFKDDNFFSGNKQRIKLKLPFHQIEGITTANGLQYYLSNEAFKHIKGLIDVAPKLHILDLSPYLKDYISTFETNK